MIRAILFDADGVVQRAGGFEAGLVDCFGVLPEEIPKLVREIFAAELPGLRGEGQFPELLISAFARQGVRFDEQLFLANWCRIVPNQEVMEVIAELRTKGIFCGLASNQERLRANHMSTVLDYRTSFDAEFYSCNLGHAKPSASYFEAVLSTGRLRAQSTLFIDDRRENVQAAKEFGLHAAQFVVPEAGARGALHAILADFGLMTDASANSSTTSQHGMTIA